MKPYSKLSKTDKSLNEAKNAVHFNLQTINQPLQHLLAKSIDIALHDAVNSCLERFILELDKVFIEHSKSEHNENQTKKPTNEDA